MAAQSAEHRRAQDEEHGEQPQRRRRDAQRAADARAEALGVRVAESEREHSERRDRARLLGSDGEERGDSGERRAQPLALLARARHGDQREQREEERQRVRAPRGRRQHVVGERVERDERARDRRRREGGAAEQAQRQRERRERAGDPQEQVRQVVAEGLMPHCLPSDQIAPSSANERCTSGR